MTNGVHDLDYDNFYSRKLSYIAQIGRVDTLKEYVEKMGINLEWHDYYNIHEAFQAMTYKYKGKTLEWAKKQLE